jgi:hypothetical protein
MAVFEFSENNDGESHGITEYGKGKKNGIDSYAVVSQD